MISGLQATDCRLVGIQPVDGDKAWPDKVHAWCRQYYRIKEFDIWPIKLTSPGVYNIQLFSASQSVDASLCLEKLVFLKYNF